MKMTLDQYILNPMGKNNAILNAATRESIRTAYTQKFGAVLLRENGKLNYSLYYDKKNNSYWAHLKVPSEVVPKFYYDVVFKFTADSNIEAGGEKLNKYYVRFFSNDPAFVYTYAHVFHQNDLLIKELDRKMSKIALKKAPKEKNPLNAVGYVKAIYFGYLYMQQRGLLEQKKFKTECRDLNIKNLLADIEEADSKIAKRQEEGERIQKKEKKSSSTGNKTSKSILEDPKSPLRLLKTKTVGKISTGPNKIVKSVKSTKRK